MSSIKISMSSLRNILVNDNGIEEGNYEVRWDFSCIGILNINSTTCTFKISDKVVSDSYVSYINSYIAEGIINGTFNLKKVVQTYYYINFNKNNEFEIKTAELGKDPDFDAKNKNIKNMFMTNKYDLNDLKIKFNQAINNQLVNLLSTAAI